MTIKYNLKKKKVRIIGVTMKVAFIKIGNGEQLIDPKSLIGYLLISKFPKIVANNNETIKPKMKNGTAIIVKIFNIR